MKFILYQEAGATPPSSAPNATRLARAAREYVGWAGLGRGNFDALMASNPTRDQIKDFLSGSVLNYNDTDTSLATEGWCKYRSPAPYGDEYQGYNNLVCSSPVIGIVLPPTPSYEQLVRWGAAQANYPLLSSGEFQSRGSTLVTALSIALPLSAVALGVVAAYAPAVNTVIALAAFDEISLLRVSALFSSAYTALTGLTLALIVLTAIATAIIVGINVTNAAELPGKLATLVTNVGATPDITTYVDGSDTSKSLFRLFVAAATPAPELRTCDNLGSVLYTVIDPRTGARSLIFNAPCLNPTPIPAPSVTDHQFFVKGKNATTETNAASITWKNTATGTLTTARLNRTWFITHANGTTAQTLRIAYTDWDGKQQSAWLVGNGDAGYTFLTYSAPSDTSTAPDPKTCVANKICGVDTSIKYIGADGQPYSARVRPYVPPASAPTYTDTPRQSQPVALNANGFAPGGAVGAITYRWRFQQEGCLFTCMALDPATLLLEPIYSDPVSGANPSFTWQSVGNFKVELTATDSTGLATVSTFTVSVASVAPAVTLNADCSRASLPCNLLNADVGTPYTLGGTLARSGSYDDVTAIVDWGDGSANSAMAGPKSITIVGNPLTLTPTSGLSYALQAKHTYATPGTYPVVVTVSNVSGDSVSQALTVTAGPPSRSPSLASPRASTAINSTSRPRIRPRSSP